jgi:zinc-binding alcohol dehydrogenase family protein
MIYDLLNALFGKTVFTMKAIACAKTGSPYSLELENPQPGPQDLLVEVKGVSVNPVDLKVRARMQDGDTPKVIGYDAAGIVREVGGEVSGFRVGDEVFYAGDVTRSGTNAEFHLVDERIAGKKPTSLGFAEAAGFPLTSITAWEMLFDSFDLKQGAGAGDSLLVIGGAGGVGSILIQLAKRLTGLRVIATASRPETVDWVRKMGADEVINHRKPLAGQMTDLGISPRYVASLNGTEGHFPAIVELIRPRGHIAVIDDPMSLNIKSMKLKALTFSWEYMFARSMFQTDDIGKQRELLDRVSGMIDAGELVSTVTNNLGGLNLESLKDAHRLQESGSVIGKNVLEGF